MMVICTEQWIREVLLARTPYEDETRQEMVMGEYLAELDGALRGSATLADYSRDVLAAAALIIQVVDTPFHAAAHAWLIANGYTHKRMDAEWEDTGDAESGPRLDGHPAFDEYTSDTDYVIIDERGFQHCEKRDMEWEAHVDAMEAGSCDPIHGQRMDSADMGEN